MISDNRLSILRCPACKSDLSEYGSYLVCVGCDARFPVVDNMVVFLTEADLAGFFGVEGGSELKEEGYRFGHFASTADSIEDLKKVLEESKTEVNRSDWPVTAPGFSEEERMKVLKSSWMFTDPGLSEEMGWAIVKSYDEIVELSRVASAKTVIDWPTGPGACLRYLMNHVEPETLVIGVDINFGTLARTKAYFDEYGFSDQMLFVIADARNMPFKDGVFGAATALGGTVEIANAEVGFRETYRVLEKGGWFGITGDQYQEDSPSMKIAEKLGGDSLLTRNRLETAMNKIGFRNIAYEVLFEGYDCDDLPDEERCPLPARGDWYQHIAAAGRK